MSNFPFYVLSYSDHINTMITTFDFNLIYIKLLNSIETHKHRSQEKLSVKTASL